MFKRGSKGLSARERRNQTGDWYAKVKISEGRWLRVRLCSDADVSRRWLDDLKHAVVRRRNDEVPDWDRIKRDRVPGRLIRSQSGTSSFRRRSTASFRSSSQRRETSASEHKRTRSHRPSPIFTLAYQSPD